MYQMCVAVSLPVGSGSTFLTAVSPLARLQSQIPPESDVQRPLLFENPIVPSLPQPLDVFSNISQSKAAGTAG